MRWTRTRGEKGIPHPDPDDPPRRRANRCQEHLWVYPYHGRPTRLRGSTSPIPAIGPGSFRFAGFLRLNRLVRRENLPDANRLADLSDRFFVVVLDPGIDDECDSDELPFAGVQDARREHHVDAGLLPLARAGHHEITAFRLGQIVVFDILKIVKEP